MMGSNPSNFCNFPNRFFCGKMAANSSFCRLSSLEVKGLNFWNKLLTITIKSWARFKEKGYKCIQKYSYVVPDGGHRKEHGWLDATHYLFNNVMREKDPKRGFSPKSKRKLNPNETPWYAFQRTVLQLEMVVKDAEAYIEKVSRGKGCKIIGGSRAKAFLVPFDGKVTIADLLKIDREELANARKFHR